MQSHFRVTYEIVTPESAGEGEADEIGFVLPGGWNIPLDEALRDPDGYEMDLRAALQLCDPAEDCGQWFAEYEGRHDYQTGAEERRSLHPPQTITPASYGRLRRLLKIR